ncbi:LOW QUALITY PROTEIN: uncharacterized protein [Procambarus clarkii]|uniref:LOW QUALITY PROTEIN: uncharacterized protein n=1 Tax=Procambarus clarkii TaxID=6728 RepID=UPI0037441C89
MWWLEKARRVAAMMAVWSVVGAVMAAALHTTLDHDSGLPPLPSLADLMESMDDEPFDTLADLDKYSAKIRDRAHVLISKAFAAETRRYKRALDIKSVNVTGTHPYDVGFGKFIGESYWLGAADGKEPALLHLGELQQKLGDLHMFQANAELFLVVGEHYFGNSCDAGIDSALFMLMGKYFDRVDGLKLRTKGVQAITGFADSGNYYLVLGLRCVDGSQVYKFDSLMNSIELIQQLSDDDVLEVLHYVDRHDRKHYVVTLNNGGTPKIYWWTREQLQEWQNLQSKPIDRTYSIGINFFDNLENLILLSHGSEITFYTDDMSAHYIPTFTAKTSCTTVSNLHGIKMAQDYVIIYTCQNLQTGKAAVEGMKLIYHDIELLESEKSADSLLKCLDELGQALEQRREDIAYIEDLLSSNSLMTVDNSQTWSGPIIFTQGLTVSGTTTFADTLTLKGSVDATNEESFSQFVLLTSSLQNNVNALVNDSTRILYFTGDQTLAGPITASSLTIDKAYFNLLKIQKINGIPLLGIEKEFLISGVDQVIDTSVTVTSMKADLFTTRSSLVTGTINGILTADFMRKSVSNQVIKGEHTYKTLTCGGISNTASGVKWLSINGIDSSTIVTKGANVTFLDKKIFNKLKVLGQINTGLVNGMDASGLANNVIYTDVTHTQTLTGSYSFASVQVDGNVDVTTINGINLRDLDASVVKTSGDFTLKGPITYKTGLTVGGDLNIGSINGLDWDNLVDLQSQDVITANYYFSKGFVSDAVRCDNINGLDLSKDVVLTDTQQTIYAGVTMGEGVTINNIDISSLKVDATSLGVLVVEDPANFTVPLTCTGDVTVQTINGLVLDGIEERYWRRSVDQDINVRVHINQAIFLNEVTGSSINGNQMTDYLDFGSSQLITGSYTFQSSVRVKGNLELGPESTVNGIDIGALNNTVMTLSGDQTIEGPVECKGRMTIENLSLSGRLNGMDLYKDFMRLDQSLWHTGHVTFASKTVATHMKLNGHLTVDSLNGFDVQALAADMVLVDQDAIIEGSFGLQFTSALSVQSLNVSGTIDGVNIEDLMRRALMKSTTSAQEVTGRVTVTGGVHFQQPPTLAQVNSKNWEKHLNDVVLKDYSGIITGTKTFLQPLNIRGNFDPTTINGINVIDLASRCLTKSGDQVIPGHYTFNSSINVSYLYSPIIDGVNVSNILLVDQIGNLGGTVTFMADVTFIGDITVLNSRPIIKDQYGNVNIQESVRVEHLTVTGNIVSDAAVVVGLSQKVDLAHFLDALVLKSVPQEIYGSVSFLGEVNVTSMTAITINNVDVVELYKDSVMDNEDTVITCNLEFSSPLTVNNVVVTASLLGQSGSGVLINGVSVAALYSQAVLANGHTFVITGNKTFSNGFSTDSLTVNKTLGGVAVSDLVVFSTTGQVAQEVSFVAPISIHGNLKVLGLLDGVDLSYIFAKRVMLNETQTLYGACKFDAISVKGDLEVEKINDVLIADLVVKVGKSSQIITGIKTFNGGLTVNGPINTTLLNGLDISTLGSAIVRTDQNYTIKWPVTFEASVRASLYIAEGTVGRVDVHRLSQNISLVSQELDSRNTYIRNLYRETVNITKENYAGARDMFLVLAYLEKLIFNHLGHVGGLKFITNYRLIAGNNFLSVKSCNRNCVCDAETRLYRVGATGSIAEEASLVSSGSLFVLSHPSLDLQITLNLTCTPSVSTHVEVETIKEGYLRTVLKTQPVNGLVADAGLFVDGGMTYIVTAAMFEDERNASSKAMICTLKYDHNTARLTLVWEEVSQRSATKLDLTMINNQWFLLVANRLGSENVNVYTAVSKLYVWDGTGERFIAKGEYVADHVTCGMFLKSSRPVEENFFTLTQLKAAKYPVFEDNLEYTKKVLVFRYNNDSNSFAEFESLDTFGVVDQATVTVGDSLYLLLLSQVKEKLDIYEYFPLEGFKLYQKVAVGNPYALEVIVLQNDTFVVVSTTSPEGILTLKVNTKGVDQRKLN